MIGKLKVSQHRTAHNAMAIAEALRISNPALAELVRIDQPNIQVSKKPAWEQAFLAPRQLSLIGEIIFAEVHDHF